MRPDSQLAGMKANCALSEKPLTAFEHKAILVSPTQKQLGAPAFKMGIAHIDNCMEDGKGAYGAHGISRLSLECVQHDMP